MSNLNDIRRELESLEPKDFNEIANWILGQFKSPAANQPSEHGIERTPGVCGGKPRIANTRIPIWLLELMRRRGASEAHILADYPRLTAADLVNAWRFADLHQEELDQQIRANQGA